MAGRVHANTLCQPAVALMDIPSIMDLSVSERVAALLAFV